MDFLKHRLHRRLVFRIGRADELIVRDVQRRPHLPELPCHAVHELLRVNPGLCRRFRDLLPVFVRARQEIRLFAKKPPVAREYICGNRRVGVSNVRVAVDVVDRGGDVEGLAHAVS